MYIHTYVHTLTHICIYADMYVYTHTYMAVHEYIYTIFNNYEMCVRCLLPSLVRSQKRPRNSGNPRGTGARPFG